MLDPRAAAWPRGWWRSGWVGAAAPPPSVVAAVAASAAPNASRRVGDTGRSALFRSDGFERIPPEMPEAHNRFSRRACSHLPGWRRWGRDGGKTEVGNRTLRARHISTRKF